MRAWSGSGKRASTVASYSGDQMTRFTERDVRQVLVKVFSDPHRMIDAIANADDSHEAVAALSAAFELTEEQAALVLDQQLLQLTRSKLADLTDI